MLYWSLNFGRCFKTVEFPWFQLVYLISISALKENSHRRLQYIENINIDSDWDMKDLVRLIYIREKILAPRRSFKPENHSGVTLRRGYLESE